MWFLLIIPPLLGIALLLFKDTISAKFYRFRRQIKEHSSSQFEKVGVDFVWAMWKFVSVGFYIF